MVGRRVCVLILRNVHPRGGNSTRAQHTPFKSTHKRLRQDSNSSSVKEHNKPKVDKPKVDKSKGSNTNEHKANKGPIIFNIGNGAKSTINMKEVGPNQFIMLHDDHNDTPPDAMHEDVVQDTPNGDEEKVLETQIHDDAMAM